MDQVVNNKGGENGLDLFLSRGWHDLLMDMTWGVRVKSRAFPRLLAEAVGLMELPVTEMEEVGREAVSTLFYLIVICVCWEGWRSQEFGLGHDEIEVHFRHPSGDADRPMDIAAGVAGSELSWTYTLNGISKWMGLRVVT